MRKPIHVQAEELGLQLPLGCSAKVIRFLGYDISWEVLDCEVYSRQDTPAVESQFEVGATGYVWNEPPGVVKIAVRSPADPDWMPLYRWVYVLGKRDSTETLLPPEGAILATDEDLTHAVEANHWYRVRRYAPSAESAFSVLATPEENRRIVSRLLAYYTAVMLKREVDPVSEASS